MKQIAAIACLAAIALGACAETRGNSSSGIAESLTGTAFGPKPWTPAPFVTASRPAETQYMAVGVTPPARGVKPKTKAEVAATEAQLAGQAQVQTIIGAQTAAEGQRVTVTSPKPPVVAE